MTSSILAESLIEIRENCWFPMTGRVTLLNMVLARLTASLLRNWSQRKHLLRWLKSFQKEYFLRMGQPWLVFDAIDVLDAMALEDKRVFEYGSGGSTLFWQRHGALLTSIEHDPSWYRKVRDNCLDGTPTDYRLIEPEYIGDQMRDPSDPDQYASEDKEFSQYIFRDYCKQIDEFPDSFFDVILIDGRARPSCIKHSCKKVRVDGVLILDNSDREHYLSQASALLHNFEQKIFVGATPRATWFTETSVFTRKR